MKAWKLKGDWVLKMASTVARTKVELMKAQVRYKCDFDRRLKHGNDKIKVGDYFWLDCQSRSYKDNLGRHTEGTFIFHDRTKRTFVIQLNNVFERVNRGHVGWTPTPTTTEVLTENEGNLEVTPKDLEKKHRSDEDELVNEGMGHKRIGAAEEFKLDFQGEYEPAWEPKENILEEPIYRYLRPRRNSDQNMPQKRSVPDIYAKGSGERKIGEPRKSNKLRRDGDEQHEKEALLNK